MDDELNKLIFETQKQYKKSNKLKDKIIILLTVLMFAEAVIFYGGFVWYESQFDKTIRKMKKQNKTNE